MPVFENRILERVMVITPPTTQYTQHTLFKSRIVGDRVTRTVEISVRLKHIIFGDKSPTTKEDVRITVKEPGKGNEYHQILRGESASAVNKKDTISITKKCHSRNRVTNPRQISSGAGGAETRRNAN